MNIVDSCGWLEYFSDGVNANFFAPIIEDTNNLIIPAICFYEVFKSILIQRDETSALKGVSAMKKATAIPLDETLSMLAAKISTMYKIPMADSIIYATATKFNSVIYTQDKDFFGLPNVQYIEKNRL